LFCESAKMEVLLTSTSLLLLLLLLRQPFKC
jgi:hypothetical protein